MFGLHLYGRSHDFYDNMHVHVTYNYFIMN